MLRNEKAILIACLSCVTVASAQNNIISEWGGAPPETYQITQLTKTVDILAPGTFKFQARDPAGPGGRP